MDYRELVKKYGNQANKAITDQAFIDWLIEVLKAEGFGDAKTTILTDGNEIDTIKTAEDASTVTYKINKISVNDVSTSYIIAEGINQEWGKIIAADELTIDLTITRRTYSLNSVDFTNLSEADKTKVEIDSAGVNDDLNTDYPWLLAGITNNNQLVNGDTLIGTVETVDGNNRTVLHTISINRQNRYIWGILRGVDTVSNIASFIGSATGNIIPSDDDPTFLQLTTGLGTIPSTFDISTLGENRTFFLAVIDSDLNFELESGISFPIGPVTESVSMTSLSGGDSNVTRTYNFYTLDLNTNFTLKRI